MNPPAYKHPEETLKVALNSQKTNLLKQVKTDFLLWDAKELEGLRRNQGMPQFELREASVKSCWAHPAGRWGNLPWTPKQHCEKSPAGVYQTLWWVGRGSHLDLPHSTVPSNPVTDKWFNLQRKEPGVHSISDRWGDYSSKGTSQSEKTNINPKKHKNP